MMTSLRGRLVVWLCAAVLVVGAAAAALAYYRVSQLTRSLLDNQLRQVASLVATQTTAVAPAQRAEDEGIDVAVWSAEGVLLYASNPLLKIPGAQPAGYAEVSLHDAPYRIFTAELGGRHVSVAQAVDAREDQAEAAALAALAPALTLLPVLACLIIWMIRRLMRPVREIADVVARREPLSGESLQAGALPAEITPLIEEINRLLERQRDAIQRESDFLADAAHALRTPLAALQLQADVLDGSSDPEERHSRLLALRSGIRRAAHLSEQLLAIAHSQAPERAAGREIDADAVLHEVHALYQPIASDVNVVLRLSARSHGCVRAERRDLLLICTNLLDNALRHAPAGTQIELVSERDERDIHIEVRDEGPGVPPEQLAGMFSRLARGGGERIAGRGLGLMAVSSLTARLGGRVLLANRSERSGFIARVSLRCSAAAPA